MAKLFLSGMYSPPNWVRPKTIWSQMPCLSELCLWTGHHRKSALVVLLFLLSACSMMQVAPIQTGRVAQLETFRHTFNFNEAGRFSASPPADYFDPAILDINQKIERKFALLLGRQNWQTLKDMYGLADIRDELIRQEIDVRGVAQMYLSIDPYDHQRFLVEGTGKYFLVRGKNGAILLAGDFLIEPNSYKIDELDKGELILKANLFPTHIPGQIAYYHPAKVRYRIKIDTSRKSDSIYFLNYAATHDVHLLQAEEEALTEGNKLGDLSFQHPEHGATKLLDLRGIKLLRTDY